MYNASIPRSKTFAVTVKISSQKFVFINPQKFSSTKLKHLYGITFSKHLFLSINSYHLTVTIRLEREGERTEEREGEKENTITMVTKIHHTHLAKMVNKPCHVSGHCGIHNFITVNTKHVTPDPFTLIKPLPG